MRTQNQIKKTKSAFIATLVGLFVVTGCASFKQQTIVIDNSTAKGQAKIISYNIRRGDLAKDDGSNAWKKRRNATLEMIKREAPSAFGLQEALIDQVQFIAKAFPQYGHVGVGRDNGKTGGEIMAIFYLKDKFTLLDSGTYWLSETPDKVSRGWDAACNRTLTWVKLQEKTTGKTLYYFNTHLDHKGEIARQESVKLIVQIINDKVPAGTAVVLGGDLNSTIENAIFDPLRNNGMLSARATAPVTDGKGTFNAFGTAPTGIILDHFFLRNTKAISFRTLDGDYGAPYISDHYPIETVIEL